MLGHVQEEEVVLADGVDRRRDREHHQRDPGGEERRSRQPGDALAALGERSRAPPVGECDDDRDRERRRLDRPGGEERCADHASHCRPKIRRLGQVAEERTYAAAGVSLATADAIVERLRAAVASTATPAGGRRVRLASRASSRSTTGGCSPPRPTRSARSSSSAGAPGSFAGAVPISPRTASTTCSRRAPSRSSSSTTSPPTRSTPEQVAELVEGAADVCRAAGCAILGGETAELPGIYRDEEIDFCGTLRRRRRPGRGWSTARASRRATSSSGSRRPESTRTGSRSSGGSSVTKISTPSCFYRRRGCISTTFAHCASGPTCGPSRTSPGGGIAGNLARALPDGLGAVVDVDSWRGRRSTAGSPTGVCPRTSCAACSTSASATAPSSRPRDVR